MNINVFLLFFSFVFLQIERERERERERYIKLVIRRNSPKVTYLISLMEFRGESFFCYGLIDFMLFLILAWRKWLLQSEIFFVFLYPEYLALVLTPTNPAQQLTFLTIYFRWREGVPTSVLGSQPIIWLLSSSSWCPATWVRLPSTNICWYPLCDLHSFLTVTLWRLATVHSNGRIVLILFLSSQWDTTWQCQRELFLTYKLCTCAKLNCLK